MSTTVTYKGQTLTTVENQTKTLNTAGTWVEGDFTLTDVTQGGGGGNEDDIIERNSINLTNTTVTKVGRLALSHMPVTGLYLPNVTTAADSAFEAMTGLTTLTDANLPNLNGDVQSTAFGYITSLTTVNLTSSMNFGTWTYHFRGCTNMTECRLPNMRTLNNNFGIQRTFYGCSKLVLCDLGKATGIGINSFQGCTALRTVILRNESVGILNGWNANVLGGIYSNPTASTIYVPSALVSSYQTASNWSSAYAAGVTFAPIEGSIYE